MHYFDYLKSAFISQINLVCIAGAGLFTLVSWNWIPLIIGGVCEALYLTVVPPLPWYHRRFERKKWKIKQELIEAETKKILSSLPQSDREKFQRLVAVCDEIKKNYAALHPATQFFLDAITQKLDRLLARYLRIRQVYDRSEKYLSSTGYGELQNKLQHINTDIRQANERIRDVQEKQKAILEKRLEKRSKVEDNNNILRTQLETIEQFILLMKDQSLTLKEPGEVTGQIESMMGEVESTESTVKELEGFYDENDEEKS